MDHTQIYPRVALIVDEWLLQGKEFTAWEVTQEIVRRTGVAKSDVPHYITRIAVHMHAYDLVAIGGRDIASRLENYPGGEAFVYWDQKVAPTTQPAPLSMEWVTVDSSWVEAIAYDTDEEVLGMKTLAGNEYQWECDDPRVFVDWLNSPSKGQYYNDHIKDEFQPY